MGRSIRQKGNGSQRICNLKYLQSTQRFVGYTFFSEDLF